MTDMVMTNKLLDRKNLKLRKREIKKREIADSAISALKLYGYARTTLRDVAAHSEMSLGSLHYYFEDKDELIIYCVRQYKVNFVETVMEAVKGFETLKDIKKAFCLTLAKSLVEDPHIHRLWYDIRNQAMFDATFVPVVAEIEKQLISMMEPFADTPQKQEILYISFDGAFRFLLQKHLSGEKQSAEEMSAILFNAASSTDLYSGATNTLTK